ncbi:MAG TPA: hypothetical protein VGU73_07615, partial [Acidimicrobiia bacterium]|nr:hypothetical protein [Acidimicrobiia bacterium]
MVFAARYEDPPAVWGVGRVVVGDEVQPWPVSAADVDDETESMASRLAELGLGDGGLVLIVSLLSEAIHVAPFERAAGTLGARYSSADATNFDAFRTVSLVRQLRPSVVLGVNNRVCDGVADLERDLADVFAGVGAVVAADDDSDVRLNAAELPTGRWLLVGPTSAVRTPGASAFAYDAARWRVEEDAGELLVTNLAP